MMTLARLIAPTLPRSPWLLAVLALFSVAVYGTTVYKSVDAEGRVHYSDQPPAGNTAVEEIHLPDAPPVSVPDTTSLVEQMAATTARLKEDRLEREKERQPDPRPQPSYYPQPPQEPQSYRHPWPWGYVAPPHRGKHHRPPQREAPDLRNERDRRRDERQGTWYVPKRLPDFGPSRR